MRLWLSSLLLGCALVAGADEAEESLSIVRLDLLDRAGGYAIPTDSVYYPGEVIYLAFNISGYTVDEDYNIRLKYKIHTVGPAGRAFSTSEGGAFAHELAPQDDGWEPSVRFSAKLPDHAGSGYYMVFIEVTDEIADETVKAEVAAAVEGEDVETSADLTVRNFGFSLTDGGQQLDKPYYSGGDSIWAWFYITGYATRDDNTYEVESELRVVNGKGETMYAFEPKGEKGSPFYPRLWLPAKFRLDLEKTIPSGAYTVLLSVRDKVGKTSYEGRHTFVVR